MLRQRQDVASPLRRPTAPPAAPPLQSLDLYEERLAEMQRTDLEDRFSRHASVLLPLCHDGRTGEPSVLFTLRASSLRAHSGEVSFPGGKRDTDDAHAEACALRECMEEVGLAPERMLGRWHDITNKEGTAAVTPCIAYLGTIDVDAINSNPDEVGRAWPHGDALAGRNKEKGPGPFGGANLNTSPLSPPQVEEVFLVPLQRLADPELRSHWSSRRALQCWPRSVAQWPRCGPLSPAALTPFSAMHRPGFPGVKMPQFDGGPHRIWGLTAYILAGFLNTIVFPPTPGKL